MKKEDYRDRFVNVFRGMFNPVTHFFVRIDLNPNWFTTLSLILCLIASYYYAKGSLRWAALIMMIGGLFDMIDGQVARASNRVTRFGALYDSTLDRFSEIFIFIGLSYYMVDAEVLPQVNLGLKAAIFMLVMSGSLMVSYVRARAEGLGFECKKGFLQRPERFILLILSSLISRTALMIVIIFLAFFTHFTAIQRLVNVFRYENSRKWEKVKNTGHE